MCVRYPVLVLVALLVSVAQVRGAPRPDIVLIMSDDMGFSDIGCYGGEIETPNLDRLAANGVRFTQFYNTARCCPTRASLLTGLYPHQAGIGHMMGDRGQDGYRGNLNDRCVTIAEVLRAAGYGTYMAGKWHVTRHTRPDDSKHNWPLQRGFERFYGTIHGAGSFFDPNTLTRDNEHISPYADPEYKPETFYYTDAISDHTVRFIREHCERRPEAPFFVYVSHTAAHWPMHALERDIAKYRGRYDEGYAPVRASRLERLRELGMVERAWGLSPQAETWRDDPAYSAWESRCMEVYAAMVDNMDQGIGRIVAELERLERLDNTLILFLQDNGGCAEGMGRRGQGKPRADKPPLPAMAATDLQPAMRPKQTRDGYPVRQGVGVMPGPADTYIGYGRGWANVSNTPFREYKHWVHEGGIATPLVVHWPNGIRGKGGLVRVPSHLIDVMPTCVAAAGAAYPTEYRGKPIQAMEGADLGSVFNGGTVAREAIYWEHEGNRAVRVGDWKLVAKGRNGAWELYDLAKDRTELANLAAEHPERVAAMAAQWEAWGMRANVLPWPGGKKAKKKKTASPVGSRERRFVLKQGDVLAREASPRVDGVPFRVTATVEAGAGDGVIVAQGGSSLGYALYVREGKLEFAVRDRNRQTVVAAAGPVSADKVVITASVAADGTLTLAADGRRLGAAKAAGPISSMPLDGVEVGRDDAGLVGRYGAENAFGGTVHEVRIEVERE